MIGALQTIALIAASLLGFYDASTLRWYRQVVAWNDERERFFVDLWSAAQVMTVTLHPRQRETIMSMGTVSQAPGWQGQWVPSRQGQAGMQVMFENIYESREALVTAMEGLRRWEAQNPPPQKPWWVVRWKSTCATVRTGFQAWKNSRTTTTPGLPETVTSRSHGRRAIPPSSGGTST